MPYTKTLLATCLAAQLGGFAVAAPIQAEVPLTVPARLATEGLNDAPAVQRLPATGGPVTGQDLVLHSPIASDPLPALTVAPFKVSAKATLEDALRMLAVVAQADDLTLTIQPGPGGSPPGMAMSAGLRGSFQGVLDTLADAYGFHYQYEAAKQTLRVFPDKQFILRIPSVPELADSMAESIARLGAQQVSYNKLSGLLSYRATRPVAGAVESYVQAVRAEQRQIVYEVSIIEVRLSDETAMGIQWNKLDWSKLTDTTTKAISLGSAPGVLPATGLSLGLVLNSGNFSMDGLIRFLDTQGAVKIVSQPLVPVLSGMTGRISVGDNVAYVSEIATSQLGSTFTAQTSAATSMLKTGTELQISGRLRDGTVYTQVKLKTSELLNMNPTKIGDNALQLPHTSDREFETPALRIRPGDSMLLGGIITSREENTTEAPSFPVLGRLFTTGKSTGKKRTELVVVLRPKISEFLNQEAR